MLLAQFDRNPGPTESAFIFFLMCAGAALALFAITAFLRILLPPRR